jgi:thioredoxin 1
MEYPRKSAILLFDYTPFLISIYSMPTFLIFKKGAVSETIRGANPSALRTAVSRASSDSGKAAASAVFTSKGYTLGTASAPGRTVGGGEGSFLGGLGQGGTGLADSMVRFMGLYLTTLFSFDAYAAAEASPFKVGAARR